MSQKYKKQILCWFDVCHIVPLSQSYMRSQSKFRGEASDSMKAPLLFGENKITSEMGRANEENGEFPSRVITAFSEHGENETPNVISTSRYNLITFLPMSIFEQFRRLANVFFLCLGIVAAVGEYTNYYETSVQAVGILTKWIDQIKGAKNYPDQANGNLRIKYYDQVCR